MTLFTAAGIYIWTNSPVWSVSLEIAGGQDMDNLSGHEARMCHNIIARSMHKYITSTCIYTSQAIANPHPECLAA